jgi:hypothetical protein
LWLKSAKGGQFKRICGLNPPKADKLFDAPYAHKFPVPWAIMGIPINIQLLCGGVVYY